MNILCIKIYGDVLPHIMEGCINAFKELGHITKTLDLCGKASQKEILRKEIHRFKPDFLFTINHIGLKNEIVDFLFEIQLPYASWWVDNPIGLLTSCLTPSKCILFVWDRYYIPILKRGGFSRVYHLPLATNPKIFRKIHLKEEEKRKWACEISFVGGAFYRGFEVYKDYQKRGASFIKAIEKTLDLYFENPSLDPIEIFAHVKEKSFTEVDEGKLRVDLELMAMCLYRKKVVEGILPLGLKVYGDKGWRILLGGKGYFGYIDYIKELPLLYNATKINLNITKSQLKTAINQRVYDVSACGGFLITDFRADLGRAFGPDVEIPFYRSIEELRENISYFLSHQKERMDIAEAMNRKVLERHTYIHRMEELIKVVREECLHENSIP